MDKNQSKFVKILITEQITLSAMFYFEQIFLFHMLINKNAREWILPITYEEHVLRELQQTFFVWTIPHCIFDWWNSNFLIID